MKKAFVCRDEKSHKFWTVHAEGDSLCVNYGKHGSVGKYEIKEFSSETQCAHETEKLIRQKRKKGYEEAPDFDFDRRVYIDQEETGPHVKTSHPRFAAHFTADFYYDCTDGESPFGSDEGADTLSELEQRVRRNPALDFGAFPQKLIEELWEMEYVPADTLNPEAVRALAAEKERDMLQSDMVTFAAAFAQIKITGRVQEALRDRALMSLKRFAMVMGREASEHLLRMALDLETFENRP